MLAVFQQRSNDFVNHEGEQGPEGCKNRVVHGCDDFDNSNGELQYQKINPMFTSNIRMTRDLTAYMVGSLHLHEEIH